MLAQFEVIRGGRKTLAAPVRTSGNDALLKQAVDFWVNTELGEFADQLCVARAIFRDFPELVTAETFPEHLIGPLAASADGRTPDQCMSYNGCPVIDEGRMAEITMKASKTAVYWERLRRA